MADKKGENVFTWAKALDWSQFSGNSEVRDKLTELRKIIEALQSSSSGSSKSGSGSDTSGSDDSSSDEEVGNRVKLVVVGDGAVGKTSLLISFSTGKFPVEYVPTVFENYACKTECEGQPVLLHLWDTAGQEDYDRLRPLSYPGSDVVLLIFATTSKLSFDAITDKWHPEITHYLPRVPYILVGSKIDIRDQQLQDPNAETTVYVTKEQGKQLAQEINAECYMELSSKTRQGLEEVFKYAIRIVLEDRKVLQPKNAPAAAAPAESGSKPEETATSSSKDTGSAPATSSSDEPVRRPKKDTKKKACTLI